jgi:hypothetical protein
MYFTDWMRYILYDNWLKVVRSKLQKKKKKKKTSSVNRALYSLPVRYFAILINVFSSLALTGQDFSRCSDYLHFEGRPSDLTDTFFSLKWLMYQTFTYKYSTHLMRYTLYDY